MRTSSIVKGVVMPSERPVVAVSTIIAENKNGTDRDESCQHPLDGVIHSSPTRETTATTIALDDDVDDDDDGDNDNDDKLMDEHEDVEANYCAILVNSSLSDDNRLVRQSYVPTQEFTTSATAAVATASVSSSAAALRRSGIDAYYHGADLDPPPTRFERSRDALLRFLDTRPVQYLGIVVLVLVIADGALFFFFLMGWQTLCNNPARTNCEPRNSVYNASIQVLTGLFTVMAVLSFPWRLTQASHAFGWNRRARNSTLVGRDLYGVPSHDVWYHIPRCHRQGITSLLVMSCILQYLNQASRILFRTYQQQSTFPGTMYVNLFFAASFLTAFAGGVWMASISERIRRQNPTKFGPGPIQVFLASKFGKIACRVLGCCCCGRWDLEVAKIEVEAQDREDQVALEHPDIILPVDPTTSEIRAHLPRRASRTELRMFAM